MLECLLKSLPAYNEVQSKGMARLDASPRECTTIESATPRWVMHPRGGVGFANDARRKTVVAPMWGNSYPGTWKTTLRVVPETNIPVWPAFTLFLSR